MAPKIMKRIRQAIWQICCITYPDDDNDIVEYPYGENPPMDSEEEYIMRMVPEKEMMKNVSDWINRCDFEKYDSYDDFCSDESTCYPSTTTYTDSEANDSESRELCSKMKDINKDLRLLSKKLDEIAYLQNLL